VAAPLERVREFFLIFSRLHMRGRGRVLRGGAVLLLSSPPRSPWRLMRIEGSPLPYAFDSLRLGKMMLTSGSHRWEKKEKKIEK
jgi:hypothetical protein